MAAAGAGRRAWVVDVETTLVDVDASVQVSRWQRQSIYRVPACIKDLKPQAYKPQVVSLGPFHHSDPMLVSNVHGGAQAPGSTPPLVPGEEIAG